MTQHVLARALDLWGLSGATPRLIAARENSVYRITHAGQDVALRLHRSGYRGDDELHSEVQWMNVLTQAGLSVPKPMPALDRTLLQVIDGIQVDVLSWLSGAPLGQTGIPLDQPDPPALFRELGRQLALLHQASDEWTLPDTFTRPAWDSGGLVGHEPLWGRFWENPDLSPAQRALMLDLRDHARNVLDAETPDYGLIHADAVRENVLVDGGTLHLIDFDDGGFGYRLFDLATALVKNIEEPAYPDLRKALIGGYTNTRPINTERLDLFMALRAATYVGWIVPRRDEPGAHGRSARMIDAACRLARAALYT